MAKGLRFIFDSYRYFFNSYRKRNVTQGIFKDWKNISINLLNKRVLIATSLGCYEHAIIVESVLAIALSLRGAKVDLLLCDEALPCCQMTKFYNVAPEILIAKSSTPRCKSCIHKGLEAFSRTGLHIRKYNQFMNAKDIAIANSIANSMAIDQINSYNFHEFAVGEHAWAGALRYYARGDLIGESHGELILRRYLSAAILTVNVIERLFNENSYDCAVFHHGIYVPQGLIGEVCRKAGIHVVNWNPAYRKHSFVFSHHDSYHHTMISEPVEVWETMDWDISREKTIMDYLKSRWHGTEDWIWFHEGGIEASDVISKETGVDFSKPCIGLLTSVMWDAQLHYKSNAFKSMLEWVVQTIDYFQTRSDLQLLVRIHPAETTGLIPSRQKMKDEIDKIFPSLPPNVFIIPPESPISTYSAMQQCNSVIIYNTKAGIEISSMGIPVIVTGEAWIRNKGFCIDVNSPEEYFKVLDQLPFSSRLNPDQLLRAKKYAYHFFYRRMIQLPFIVSKNRNRFQLDLKSSEMLQEGNFPGLDIICDGILEGKPFIIN